LVYNRQTGAIQVPYDSEQPLVINRLGSFVEARYAKLTKQRPVPRGIPNGNDKEDIEAAKGSGEFLEHLWRATEFEDELGSTTMQMLLTGNAFIKSNWNPFVGESFYANTGEQKGELAFGEDGEEESEEIFLGEVDSRATSPLNLIVANDGINRLRDQPWIIEKCWLTPGLIKKLWPDADINIRDDRDQKTEAEKVIERLSSPISAALGMGLPTGRDTINGEILVKYFYMQPNHQYPDGIVAVVVGNEVVKIGAYEQDPGPEKYPFVHFTEKNDGLRFWQQSTVERLIPIQRAYNRLKQKKLNIVYLHCNPKVLIPKGAQVMEDAFDDTEDEVVEYNSAVPAPNYMNIPQMPAFAREMPGELREDFSDVANQRPAIETPLPNLTAGVAMQTAAEIGEEPLGPILRRYGNSIKKVAKQQLLLVDANYDIPRMIKILGANGDFTVRSFKGADLRGHFDIHIEVESMFPEFRGAKRQTLIDLWDRRVITDPVQFMKAFRYGNFDYIIEKQETMENVVWMEIEAIKKGREPEITSIQDHMTHFRILSEWIQTPEFLRLIPERKQLALAVLQAHQQFLMQSMPGGGESVGQTNQNAVGTPFGAQAPVGTQGNGT